MSRTPRSIAEPGSFAALLARESPDSASKIELQRQARRALHS